MFAATASFAIGIKMLIEPVVGQITNTITEEYSFDPFDIEKDVKEFLKIQNKIATDAGVEIEPFKSSILDIKIEEVKETKKEEEIVKETEKEEDIVSIDTESIDGNKRRLIDYSFLNNKRLIDYGFLDDTERLIDYDFLNKNYGEDEEEE
jgi:hypothetical protein